MSLTDNEYSTPTHPVSDGKWRTGSATRVLEQREALNSGWRRLWNFQIGKGARKCMEETPEYQYLPGAQSFAGERARSLLSKTKNYSWLCGGSKDKLGVD